MITTDIVLMATSAQQPLAPVLVVGHKATRSPIDTDRLRDAGEIAVGSSEWRDLVANEIARAVGGVK
jgi:hypothetical protein